MCENSILTYKMTHKQNIFFYNFFGNILFWIYFSYQLFLIHIIKSKIYLINQIVLFNNVFSPHPICIIRFHFQTISDKFWAWFLEFYKGYSLHNLLYGQITKQDMYQKTHAVRTVFTFSWRVYIKVSIPHKHSVLARHFRLELLPFRRPVYYYAFLWHLFSENLSLKL